MTPRMKELLDHVWRAREVERKVDPEVIHERAKRILLKEGPEAAQEYLKLNGIEPDND